MTEPNRIKCISNRCRRRPEYAEQLLQRCAWAIPVQCRRWILILALVAPCRAQTGGGPGGQEAHDILRITAGTQVVLLLSGKLSGKRNNTTPSITVAQDVVVDGVRVIAAGAPAQFDIIRKPPHLFNMPGEVGFEVTSVPTISGALIAVRALQTTRGAPPCYERDCMFLPLLFWVHGDPGHIDRGLLLSATIIENVHMNRAALPASRETLVSPLVRLHLYPLSVDRSTRQGPGYSTRHLHSMGWSLDGKRMEMLTDFTYACTLVGPGSHSVRIDKDEFGFETKGINEHYLRITYLNQESEEKVIEETKGYEFEGAMLTPASLGKKGVSCFDPLDAVLKKQGQKKPGKLARMHRKDSASAIP